MITSLFAIAVSAGSGSVKETVSARRTVCSVNNWYNTEGLKNGIKAAVFAEPKKLEAGDSVSFNVNTEGGAYIPVIEYKPSNASAAECLLHISAGGSSYAASLPLLWTDADDEYKLDSYGNELYPKQKCIEEFIFNPLEDYASQSREELALNLNGGNTLITLKSDNQSIYIKSVTLIKPRQVSSYSEYLQKYSNSTETAALYVAEGERYSVKSDCFIRSGTVKNPALTPYDTYRKKINVVDGSTWKSAGQKVAWEIEVEEDGLYSLGMRYSLSNNADKPTYRTLAVDGEIPFKECEEIKITTSGNGYGNFVFAAEDGAPYKFYLTKGTHLISLRAEMGPLSKSYDDIKQLMQEITDVGTMLQKLTAGVSDENRTWDMDEYMPGTVDKLYEFADRAEKIYSEIKSLSGGKASYASSLQYSVDSLKKLAGDPEQIPNRTSLLSIGSSSASKYLGTALSQLTSNPLTVDRIYIYSNTELPAAKASAVKKAGDSVKSFFNSFVSENSGYSASYKKSDELQVWINRPIQYVQVLQQLLDESYNAENGTNIRLSVMPSEQKLILANASGTNPDVALSVGYSTPYNFAIRGAAKNLLEYDDFLQTYSNDYNLESLVPLCTDDGVYGAIESQDFYVMFYRRDTLDALGLKVPDTWDDVYRMMPELLRYSMNFCVPIASAGGSKSFSVTTPFIYQNGGKVYSDDGFKVEYNSKNSLKGFTQMTELFRIYAVQQTVADFYNSFRYNSTPIGISTFSTYMQLSVAAPELSGIWEIAPVPGVRNDDGTVLRYQMADSTASMIFENTKKPDEAWKFLKWYLSHDTQLNFTNNLQMTYGPEYRLNTSNLKAFSQLPYSEHDKNVILEQWCWQKETARHPASYMTERELSNAWINVVVNGEGVAEAIDEAVLQSEREILRKLKEFGYADSNGNKIKDYRQLTADDLYKILESKKGDN